MFLITLVAYCVYMITFFDRKDVESYIAGLIFAVFALMLAGFAGILFGILCFGGISLFMLIMLYNFLRAANEDDAQEADLNTAETA